MKKFYSSTLCLLLASFLILWCSTIVNAQTTCTDAPDPAACATLTPASGIQGTTAFSPNSPGTTVVAVGSDFTATTTAPNPTQISVTSNTFTYTGNDGCVLVKFTQSSTATVSSTDVSILVNGEVITCTGVTVTAGTVCLRICDPRITANSTISARLDFNLAAGSPSGSAVTVSAFAVATLPAQMVPCASDYVCLTGSTDCTPCDAGFQTFSGKIRVFFTTPIAAGAPNPQITSITDAQGMVLTQYKVCATGTSNTSVSRNFVDYCVYASGPAVAPVSSLGSLGIIFTGNTTPCIVPVLASGCPTTIAILTDPGNCTPCDGAFTNLAGKVRVFFENPIPANAPNPVITSITNLGLTAGTFVLCASSDANVNVSRNFVDYCVFSNVSGAVLPPLPATVDIGIQSGDCLANPTLCVGVATTVLGPCIIASVDVRNVSTVGGGTGAAGETCDAQTNCNGSVVYFASRLRVVVSPCLPSGTPAPSITSAQFVDANGNVTALNNTYCFVLSDESAAAINTERCFVEYCVYSQVLGDPIFSNLPAGTKIELNISSTVPINGAPTTVVQTCEGTEQDGSADQQQQVAAPLPLNLLDFKASLVEAGVKLNWTTSEEVNVSHFEILRSGDGSNFSKINKVNARGGAGNTNYELTDAVAINGKAFYRLNMVDLDGRSKFSQIVMIRLNGKNQPVIVVAPNPVQSTMKVKMSDFAAGAYNLELRNSIGQLQYVKAVQLNGNEHTETIQRTKAMSKGLYVLTIYNKADNSRNSMRVIIE